MKCAYCHEKAGFLKRTCRDCLRLIEVVNKLPEAFGFRELLDALLATGISNEKIDLFLETDVTGDGSLHEKLAARMTNEVMSALGQPSQMKGSDVKRVKEMIREGKPPSKTDEEVVDYSQLPKKG